MDSMTKRARALQRVLDGTVDDKKVFGTSFALKKDDYTWVGASGNLTPEQPFFIASTTKLFTTALLLHLRSEKKVNLDDPIKNYINNDIINNLHVFKHSNYSDQLTIKHLLAHTSGLPDYFQGKDANGTSLEAEIVGGKDQYWTFDQVIQRTKVLHPVFAPGTKNKAHYSDTNFQLLGKIIESVTGHSYASNCKTIIIDKINLNNTYLYQDSNDLLPKSLYYKQQAIHLPKAMASFGPDGGMVSTSPDLLQFIVAFFSGSFFPQKDIEELLVWNRIFFPMQSGIGLHKFALPWILNPLGTIPTFLGHSGLSGALAYYSPKHQFFIAGTVNQIAYPSTSFKTMIKLFQTLGRSLT